MVDPASGFEGIADILAENGKIVEIGPDIRMEAGVSSIRVEERLIPHSVDITLNSLRLRLSLASALSFFPVLWVSFPSAAATSLI